MADGQPRQRYEVPCGKSIILVPPGSTDPVEIVAVPAESDPGYIAGPVVGGPGRLLDPPRPSGTVLYFGMDQHLLAYELDSSQFQGLVTTEPGIIHGPEYGRALSMLRHDLLSSSVPPLGERTALQLGNVGLAICLPGSESLE